MGTDEESGGFKFAIMLLATLGTIIYAAYTYFQARAIDPIIYAFFVAVITALLILSILLVIYIFTKGYYMEEQDSAKKEELKRIASYIYSITFQVGAIVLLLIIGAFFFILYSNIILYLLYVVSIAFLYYFNFFGKLKTFLQNKSYLQDSISIDRLKRFFVILIIAGIIILWGFSYAGMLDLLQGDAKIEMSNIYYKNGEPIPVSIEILGRDPGLSIYLYNATSEISSITLKPKDELNKVEVGEYIIGDAFASGKYYIFINTTKMSEGYYRLAYSHSIDGRSIERYKYGKSFYLLNQSGK